MPQESLDLHLQRSSFLAQRSLTPIRGLPCSNSMSALQKPTGNAGCSKNALPPARIKVFCASFFYVGIDYFDFFDVQPDQPVQGPRSRSLIADILSKKPGRLQRSTLAPSQTCDKIRYGNHYRRYTIEKLLALASSHFVNNMEKIGVSVVVK